MHQIPNFKCFLPRIAVVFVHSIEAMYYVENKNAPTGDAPTTSEWSTILLPSRVCLILEVLRYVLLYIQGCDNLLCSVILSVFQNDWILQTYWIPLSYRFCSVKLIHKDLLTKNIYCIHKKNVFIMSTCKTYCFMSVCVVYVIIFLQDL